MWKLYEYLGYFHFQFAFRISNFSQNNKIKPIGPTIKSLYSLHSCSNENHFTHSPICIHSMLSANVFPLFILLCVYYVDSFTMQSNKTMWETLIYFPQTHSQYKLILKCAIDISRFETFKNKCICQWINEIKHLDKTQDLRLFCW